jgi:hypothetical protein
MQFDSFFSPFQNEESLAIYPKISNAQICAWGGRGAGRSSFSILHTPATQTPQIRITTG